MALCGKAASVVAAAVVAASILAGIAVPVAFSRPRPSATVYDPAAQALLDAASTKLQSLRSLVVSSRSVSRDNSGVRSESTIVSMQRPNSAAWDLSIAKNGRVEVMQLRTDRLAQFVIVKGKYEQSLLYRTEETSFLFLRFA